MKADMVSAKSGILSYPDWNEMKNIAPQILQSLSFSLSLSCTRLTLWCIGWHGVLSWPNGFLHAVWFSHYQSVHIKLEYASAHCWTGHFKTHTHTHKHAVHTHTHTSTAEAKWERIFLEDWGHLIGWERGAVIFLIIDGWEPELEQQFWVTWLMDCTIYQME